MKDFKEYLSKIQEDIEVDLKNSDASKDTILVYVDGKPYKKFARNTTLGQLVSYYNTDRPDEKITTVKDAKLTQSLGELIHQGDKIEFSKVLDGTGDKAKAILTYKK